MVKNRLDTHRQQLARNPSLLFWGKAMLEINAINAVVTLFYLHRGLRLDQIFYLSIVWSLTSLSLEVPTGYLADRFGRKRTLLLGALCLLLSWLVMMFASGFALFTGVFVLMSASFACFSGTEEAMLYDTLKELGQEKDATHHNGRLLSATSLFNIFAPALGAFIAHDLSEAQFIMLLAINSVATIIGIWLWSQLREPRHVKNLAKREIGIFRESLLTIREQPFLLRLAFNRLCITIATFLSWRAYQPFLSARGFDVTDLGIFYMAMHAYSYTMKRNAGRFEQWFGGERVLIGTVLIMIAGLATTVLVPWVWVAAAGVIAAITISGVRDPIFSHLINRRVHSSSRATTLSNLNVFKSILDIPILFVSGALAAHNLEYVFAVAIALGLAVLLFFRVGKEGYV